MRLLLGSANSSVIARWHTLLAGQHDLEQANTTETLKQLAIKTVFDLILLHRSLVDPPACAELRRLSPASRLFLLSDEPHQEEGFEFLKLGIVGYGNTYISPERIAEAVRVISSGGVWLGQQVIQRLILEAHARADSRNAGEAHQRLAALTRMEYIVAGHVARGQTNLEIAAGLNIAERTVKAHLTAIYEKLHVANRLGLALLFNQGEHE